MRKPSNDTGHRVCLILALLGLMNGATLALGPAGRASAQVVDTSWSSAGNLNTARYLHTATLLPNGKVLVVGGYNWPRNSPPNVLNSAELYDPATGNWSSAGNLNTTRSLHTATLLPNGKVLVAGGSASTAFSRTDSAELYDPATGTWSVTGNLNIARSDHTATLLPNGKVLVAGGYGNSGALASAELYDPATGTWGITGSLNTTRGFGRPATLLPNGKVLVAGGDNRTGSASNILNSAELYDPATGTWSYTGNLNSARFLHTATLVSNGKVLIAGGENGAVLNSAELYDPATGTWSYTGNLNGRSFGHTATLLPDGQVLVAGGSEDDDFSIPARPELYDPATGTWSSTANLNTPRGTHTATLLPNGKALVAGGGDINHTVLNSAELFDLGLPQAGTVASVSAASFSSMGLASEAIAASFSTGLAATSIGAATLPLPTQLAGASVKVRDSAGIERLARLFFVSPTQVNYQVPAGTASGAATVNITSGDGAVSTGLMLVNAVAPSLFTANGAGQGVAAALALRIKVDGSQQFEPVAQFDAAQNKLVARALDLGPETDQVFLILFGTGIRHRSSLSAVVATIGGAYAEVGFAGAQPDFVGVDQINVRVPRSLAGRGEVGVLLTVEAQMANAVRVNIKR